VSLGGLGDPECPPTERVVHAMAMVPYSWWRLFAILRLTPDQLAEEERWHALCREKVGTHTDYDATGKAAKNAKCARKKQRRAFYIAYAGRTPQNFASNEVLGGFGRHRGQPTASSADDEP